MPGTWMGALLSVRCRLAVESTIPVTTHRCSVSVRRTTSTVMDRRRRMLGPYLAQTLHPDRLDRLLYCPLVPMLRKDRGWRKGVGAPQDCLQGLLLYAVALQGGQCVVCGVVRCGAVRGDLGVVWCGGGVAFVFLRGFRLR